MVRVRPRRPQRMYELRHARVPTGRHLAPRRRPPFPWCDARRLHRERTLVRVCRGTIIQRPSNWLLPLVVVVPRGCYRSPEARASCKRARYLRMSYMNRRGFLLTAGAGLGLGAISLPPQMLVRMSGNVLPSPHTPDPGAWSDNSITLAWLGHATVLINFYGVRVLTDPALSHII